MAVGPSVRLYAFITVTPRMCRPLTNMTNATAVFRWPKKKQNGAGIEINALVLTMLRTFKAMNRHKCI